MVKAAAAKEYEDTSWHSVWTFAEQPERGDLAWFRNIEGRFYLAEILEPWRCEYEDSTAIGADLVNHRKARIIEVGLADAVPGKIIACVHPSRTFQAIRSPGMLAFSSRLAGLDFGVDDPVDLHEFPSDSDLENLVFVYLQVRGWCVLPGTRSATTAHYEFVLVHRDAGKRAMVHVESGGTWVDASQYGGEEKAFLFTSSGDYGLAIPGNVAIISRGELNELIGKQWHLLPRAMQTWIEVAGAPSA